MNITNIFKLGSKNIFNSMQNVWNFKGKFMGFSDVDFYGVSFKVLN